MNYEEMSDFEINAAVVKALRLPFKAEFCNVFLDHGFEEGACVYTRVDYCNNPSDAWPIIVESEIDLTSPTSNGTEEWQAVKFTPTGLGSEISCYSANPLRSAMIVFLMMKENKNEQ